MEFPSRSALENIFKTLMSLLDEETWRLVGLYDKVDQLKGGPEGLFATKDHLNIVFPNKHTTHSLPYPEISKPISSPSVPPLSDLLPNSNPFSSLQSPSSHKGLREPLETSLLVGFNRKAWKQNKNSKHLVFGNDIGLEDTVKMALSALVGRISYKSLSKDSLEGWIQRQWQPILGYSPEVNYLTKGWLGFIFHSPEDSSLLLSRLWVFGGSSLMLK